MRYSKTEAVLQGLLREWEEKQRVLAYFCKEIDPISYVRRFFPDPLIGIFPESERRVAVIPHSELIGALIWARTDFYAPYQAFFRNWYRSGTLQEVRAVVVDLDWAKPDKLEEFCGVVMPKLHCRPSLAVLSGEGVHLIYLLDPPIQALRRYRELLEEIGRKVQYKFKIKKFGWKVDVHPLIHPYRVPGSATKIGTRARGYLVHDPVRCVTLKELAEWVGVDLPDTVYEELVEGKRVGRRAENRPRRAKKSAKGVTYLPRAHPGLYNRIFEKILYDVREGHRYLSLCALVVAGWKAAIPREQVERDVHWLAEELSLRGSHPVTEREVRKALKMYNEKAVRVRRIVLERWLGVPLPGQIRHGRRREEHLRRVHAQRRGQAKALTELYLTRYPDLPITEVARRAGLSRTTIYKYGRELGLLPRPTGSTS